MSEAEQRTEAPGTVGPGVPWTPIELKDGRHAVRFGGPGLARSDLRPVWRRVIERPSLGPRFVESGHMKNIMRGSVVRLAGMSLIKVMAIH